MKFPDIVNEIHKIVIPKFSAQDRMIWCDSDTGDLSFKMAYCTIKPRKQTLGWCKTIWNKFIPPSKSFTIWRILLDRMPIDDKLWSKGSNIVSMCILCKKNYETSCHRFLNCPFAIDMWKWFNSMFGCHLGLSFVKSILSFCDRN